MSDTPTFSHQDALLDPSKHYETPNALAQDSRFSVEERLEILKAWQANEEALHRAANEGLDGGERPHLQLVIQEIDNLQAKHDN